MILLVCRIENVAKQRQIRDTESRLVVASGERVVSGLDGGFGVSRCKLLYLEWISNEILLYSTGSIVQSFGVENDGR